MQNSPNCVVMETRYMVDTTSRELLIEEKTILKFTSSALFFFSNDANGTSDFADCLTNMCISNCVRSVFFFQTMVGSMCSGLLLLWHIKLIFLTSMWVVIYPWLANSNSWLWVFFSLSSSILFVVCCCCFLFLLVFIVYHAS